jgi:hypothetical protein
MFKYRLHSPDGDDLCEATYPMMIKPGERPSSVMAAGFRVLDAVPSDDDDESAFVGLLQVEAA